MFRIKKSWSEEKTKIYTYFFYNNTEETGKLNLIPRKILINAKNGFDEKRLRIIFYIRNRFKKYQNQILCYTEIILKPLLLVGFIHYKPLLVLGLTR